MAQPGDVIEHPVTGERITFLRTTAETGGEYLRLELVVRPGGFVSAPHIHPRQEERFEIRSGTLSLVVDGEERRAGPGETFLVPAGTPHAWWNAGDDETVFHLEFRPALNAEECFESAFGLAQDGLADPPTGRPEQPWPALIFLRYRDVAYPAEPPLPALLDLFTPIAEEAEGRRYRLPYPYPYARVRQAEPRGAPEVGQSPSKRQRGPSPDHSPRCHPEPQRGISCSVPRGRDPSPRSG